MAFAAGLIDRSGQAPVIEAALAHRTGRPRPLPARAVLTALLCLALDDRPLFLAGATRLLFTPAVSRVPPAARRARHRRDRAGLQGRLPPGPLLLRPILTVADPSPLPKNRRLTGDELKARTKPMTPGQATAARDRLEALVNALLEASVSVLTDDERAAFGGGTGLDATPVPLFSRGPSRRAGLCASDPDGGWYVREGDHREREDDKGKPLRKIAWALEATIATTARPPHAEPGCPNLAIGLALTRPGEDPGGTGARVLASVAARGHKTGWLGYDRAYTQALPGRFHLPARALGYSPVMDYRADQLGIQANTGGAILVEGTWYCPALPEPLITATTRLRDHAIDPRALRPADHRPLPLPAQAQRRPRHRRLPAAVLPRPRPPPGADMPAPRGPRCHRATGGQGPPATARTAADLPPDGDHHRPGHRRPLPPGPALRLTSLAQARYATLRNTIEGLNGYVKDPAHQALAQPARRRVRGIAARSLFTALLLMAANIRKIRAWRALTASDQSRHHPPGTATPHQPARLPPRRLTRAQHPPPPRPASPSQATATPQTGQNTATRLPAPGNRPRTAARADVRPRRHNQKRSPMQFCRYDTGSSVGNPTRRIGDLNPGGCYTQPH